MQWSPGRGSRDTWAVTTNRKTVLRGARSAMRTMRGSSDDDILWTFSRSFNLVSLMRLRAQTIYRTRRCHVYDDTASIQIPGQCVTVASIYRRKNCLCDPGDSRHITMIHIDYAHQNDWRPIQTSQGFVTAFVGKRAQGEVQFRKMSGRSNEISWRSPASGIGSFATL
jgi:hypothetical protein